MRGDADNRTAARYAWRRPRNGNHGRQLTMQATTSLIHHEDIVVAEPRTHGARRVSKAEIIRFAKQFDPQPMHLSEAAARKTLVGGLCAAGYHTCAIMMRLLYDGFLKDWTSLGSPGIDEVRWLKPVRPGDTLGVRVTVLEKRDLASRPDVGLSRVLFEMINQNAEIVLSATSNQLMRRRTPSAPAKPKPSASRPTAKRPAIASLWDQPDREPADRNAHFFDDREIGETHDLGHHTFTSDEIIAFAREFDPQPFHLDEAAAKQSLFGGLAASGWHTCAIYIRQFVRSRQEREAEIVAAGRPLAAYGPSPGFRDLRWIKPVLAGDTISFRTRLSDKVDLKSRPDRGLLASQTQGRNQKGEIVFSVTGQVFAERRRPTKG